MLTHLAALIPGERTTQLCGQFGDALDQGVSYGFATVIPREVHQDGVSGAAFDESRDRGYLILPDDEISLPMTALRDLTIRTNLEHEQPLNGSGVATTVRTQGPRGRALDVTAYSIEPPCAAMFAEYALPQRGCAMSVSVHTSRSRVT